VLKFGIQGLDKLTKMLLILRIDRNKLAAAFPWPDTGRAKPDTIGVEKEFKCYLPFNTKSSRPAEDLVTITEGRGDMDFPALLGKRLSRRRDRKPGTTACQMPGGRQESR